MSAKILVVGDCMLDVYVEGTIPRMSAEANVPIFVPSGTERCQAGGAAAVAKMVSCLGKEESPHVTLAGAVGSDWAGKRLTAEIGHPIKTLFCHAMLTTTKTRLVTPLGQVARIDRDAHDVNVTNEWIDNVTDLAMRVDVVLLPDYGKGVLTDEVIAAIINTSDHVIVDPARGRPWGTYDRCWGVKANEAEAAAHERHSRDDHNWFCVSDWKVTTLGDKGLALYDAEHNPLRIAARKRPVADSTGCGDQVLAMLGVLLAEGMELPEACRWANAAGGLQCERRGIVPVTRAELEQEMNSDSQKLSEVNSAYSAATASVH